MITCSFTWMIKRVDIEFHVCLHSIIPMEQWEPGSSRTKKVGAEALN